MSDYTVGDTIYIMFTTRAFSSGVPTVLAGTPVVSAYENDSTTQITAGITLGVSHDSVVGMNLLTIVASGANGYEAGKDYSLVITTGTVGGVSVVGEVVGSFSLERSAAHVRLGAPAGASVSADIAVIESQTDDIGVAGAGLTNIGTIATVTNLTNLPSIPANWITAAGIATDAIDGDAIAASAVTEIQSGLSTLTAAAAADAVWDEALSGHLTAGSTGEALNAAGAAGDPWTTTLPGAYTGSQAGKMLSDIITDTAVIGAAGAGLTAIPWNASWDAEVQSEVADALAAFWTSPATLVDLIWDEAISGHATAGTTGKYLTDVYTTAATIAFTMATASNLAIVDSIVDAILLDTAEIGAAGAGLTAVPWNASWDAQVESEVTDALNAYDPPTNAEMVAAIPTATQNADALLNRDMSAVSDTNARSPLNAMRFLRNKYSISGTTLTVTKEDDSTSAWTSTLTTNAAADPVTGSDPA